MTFIALMTPNGPSMLYTRCTMVRGFITQKEKQLYMITTKEINFSLRKSNVLQGITDRQTETINIE